jgi:voltage-gated potassium channel
MNAEATPPSFASLEPRQRRRLVVRAALRATVTPVVLLVLYYTLPLDHQPGGTEAVWFAVGFVVFAGAAAWQVHSITHSAYPRARTIQAVSVLVPVFLLAFAGTYYLLAGNRQGSFSTPLTRTDALYFTVTVFTTVGFGDITAKSETARVLVMIQMIGGLILVGLVAKVLVGAMQAGVDRVSHLRPPGRG